MKDFSWTGKDHGTPYRAVYDNSTPGPKYNALDRLGTDMYRNFPKARGVFDKIADVGDDIKSGYQKIKGSFEKGGTVKKTGAYKLHKGEEVLNRKKAMAHRMGGNSGRSGQRFTETMKDMGGNRGSSLYS